SETASAQSAQNNDDRNGGANASEEDFEPTHGRSPEVIREMMKSRRRNDRVPDPEDIIAGHPEQSEEKKEHGLTGRGTATRRTNKQTASAKPTKAAKGKEAALDRSKPGVATGTNQKKEDKEAASRTGAKQASTRQSGQASTTKATKQTTASNAGKQTASGKSANENTTSEKRQNGGRNGSTGASNRNGAGSKSAQSSTATRNDKTNAAKPAQTRTSTRSKSSTGKGR
ncbi:MAG: hypothetical protein M3X11_17830, partial [Acidobacteriota bacterium]|nr:hypothetical protein [Acidobacteriota bacterium]